MNEEGKLLAEIVKRTHKRLRKRYRQGEDETHLWEDHVQHNEQLQTYASAMHELATVHWEGSHQVNTSRVLWTYSAIKQYFHEGELQRLVEKEMRKLRHLELESEFCYPSYRPQEESSKLQVLDVGSCYNPFAVYEDLEVTALDLYPASESVKQCDFLSLKITSGEADDVKNNVLGNRIENSSISTSEVKTEQLTRHMCSNVVKPSENKSESKALENQPQRTCQRKRLLSDGSESPLGSGDGSESPLGSRDRNESSLGSGDGSESPLRSRDRNESPFGSEMAKADVPEKSPVVKTLERDSFDVVIFCLLLEYIPSPKQRFLCCEKAYELLRPNGILCIITPDSKHQNANVHIYKLWKITLGSLGFSRTKYEKTTHFHGMVFRKGLCQRAWQLDSEREAAVMEKTQVKTKFASIDYKKVCAEIYIPQDFQEFNDSEDEKEKE